MPFGPNLNLSPLCKNIFFRFWQKRDTNIQIQRGLFVKMYFPKCTLGSPAGSTSPKPLKSGISRFHLQQREIELNFQFGISKYKRWKPKWFAQCEAKQCMEKMAAGSPKPPQMVSSPSPLVSTVALEQRRGELLRGLATPTLQPPIQASTWTSPPAKLGCRMYSSGRQQIGQIFILHQNLPIKCLSHANELDFGQRFVLVLDKNGKKMFRYNLFQSTQRMKQKHILNQKLTT